MYNLQNTQEIAKHPQLLATIGTFLASSTFAPFLALGTVGISGLLAVKSIRKLRAENRDLKEKAAYSDENEIEPLRQPVITRSEPVKPTVAEPLNPTVDHYSENTIEEEPIVGDEAVKREMIRQTMSELGKRSAAKRAKRN